MYIKVRVIANAKNESVEVLADNHLKIRVKEKALQNMANARVAELVALHYRVPVKSARLISGHHSPSKLFSLPD
jgi:uncharacterized protein YggU (UPF0235/DUF167 family)